MFCKMHLLVIFLLFIEVAQMVILFVFKLIAFYRVFRKELRSGNYCRNDYSKKESGFH